VEAFIPLPSLSLTLLRPKTQELSTANEFVYVSRVMLSNEVERTELVFDITKQSHPLGDIL